MVAMTSYEPGLDVDISHGLTVSDFGDVDVVHTSVTETHDRVTLVAQELFTKQIIPLSIGGDHSLTYPLIRGLCGATKGKVGVVYFDAHTDVRLARHGEVSSGTSFRRIFDELPGKRIDPRNVVAIGINGWHNSKRWIDYMREIGMRMITAREVHMRGVDAIIKEAVALATHDVESVYVSVDIDCLDSAFAPGTNVPGQGGLTSFELLESVYKLCTNPLVRGFDVMEVAPPLDSGNVTSYMGAAVLMQFLCALKARRCRAVPKRNGG
jgi:formimidoylglutamase